MIIRTALAVLAAAGICSAAPFGIQVVDDSTGRGVPLVELESVDGQVWITDSAGWVAFDEPGLAGREVFFKVRSHGYEYPKDGFGSVGVKLTPTSGGRAQVKLKRVNIAERLYRQTGRGIYRDSVLLGEKTPLADPLGAGHVAGQDSAQVALYKGRLFWIWGDTARMEYPLGNFRTSAAWADHPLIKKGELPQNLGVNFHYFTDKTGFSKPMAPLKDPEGVVWLDGLAVVKDEAGQEKLVARYQRRLGLGKLLEQGIVAFNDAKEIFEPIGTLPLDEEWRTLHGQVTPGRGDGYLYMGIAGLSVRVPASLKDVLDRASYEAWTAGTRDTLRRDAGGKLEFAWRKDAGPVESQKEAEWVKAGKLKAEECRMFPVDVKTGDRVKLHVGTVRFNEYRERWVMVAVQIEGKPSMLGEVWYSEADAPTGPWTKAVRIMTHDKKSFYNPVHHPFYDDGMHIYFEGTYTKDFSGNPNITPRYEYNQMMYRLDLGDARLDAVK